MKLNLKLGFREELISGTAVAFGMNQEAKLITRV